VDGGGAGAWLGHAPQPRVGRGPLGHSPDHDHTHTSSDRPRRRAGLTIHRARDLRPDEVDVHRGIPVTSPARALLDLAAILHERDLELALDRAEELELTDHPALDALARARPGHHGAGRLRRALRTHHAGTTLTRSELEERSAHRLVVETDSWTHHRSREAFEDDRARDALMARAGYRTLRFTWRQIEHDPATVAATLRSQISGP
jgi:Protein of unknown function (DUF559)